MKVLIAFGKSIFSLLRMNVRATASDAELPHSSKAPRIRVMSPWSRVRVNASRYVLDLRKHSEKKTSDTVLKQPESTGSEWFKEKTVQKKKINFGATLKSMFQNVSHALVKPRLNRKGRVADNEYLPVQEVRSIAAQAEPLHSVSAIEDLSLLRIFRWFEKRLERSGARTRLFAVNLWNTWYLTVREMAGVVHAKFTDRNNSSMRVGRAESAPVAEHIHYQWRWGVPHNWWADLSVMFVVMALLLSPLALAELRFSIQGERNLLQDQARGLLTSVSGVRTNVEQGNWSQASSGLLAIERSVSELVQRFDHPPTLWAKILRALPFSNPWREARNLAVAGQYLAHAGTGATTLADHVLRNDGHLPAKIIEAQASLADINDALRSADTLLSSIDPSGFPSDVVPLLNDLSQATHQSRLYSEHLENTLKAFSQALTTDRFKRYLVVFQNSAELRPAGGFMGSLALVDVKDGIIQHTEFPKGGPYDFTGALTLRLEPPAPLKQLQPIWQFQDANWFYDWPTSAQKIQSFYEHAGGPTVDGVIAINSPVLEKILTVIGPITVGSKAVSASNVIDVTQRAVEIDYDRKSNAPKKFIEDLALGLQEALAHLSHEQALGLASVVEESVLQKDIVVYAKDEQLEHTLGALGAAGNVTQTNGDYLAVVEANIGGGKTNRVLEEQILHETLVTPDGRLLDRVRLLRTHHGKKGELFFGGANTSYIRFYIPFGSKLVSAQGFVDSPRVNKITARALTADSNIQEYGTTLKSTVAENVFETQEFSKTVFGGWSVLGPGTEETLELVYELPAAVTRQSLSTFTWQKQPGVHGIRAIHQWILSPQWSIVEVRPTSGFTKTQSDAGAVIRFEDSLETDHVYGLAARQTQ